MNTHSDESPGQDAPGTSPSGPPPSPPRSGFFNWLRSLQITRGRERWVGGVASGIAQRLGWDPVLVRGLFVVLVIIGGVGVLAYGLAWALLPEPDGRIHTQEAGRGRWSTGMTGALVLTLIGFWTPDAWFFNDDGSAWGIWPLMWLAGIGVLIYVLVTRSRRPERNEQPPQGETWASTPAYSPVYAPATQPFMQTPPPMPAPIPPKERTGPTGAQHAIVLGLVLLAIGMVTTLGYLGNLPAATAPLAAATAVVVLGLGCVVLGLMGRRSGFIGFLAAVAIVVAQVFTLVPPAPSFALATEAQWNHASGPLATEGYALAAASGTVDLTSLSQPDSAVTVPVNVTASHATVIVPDDTRVVITTELAFSEVNIHAVDNVADDIWDERTVVVNENADGPPILLTIHGAFSSIDIHTETSEDNS